MLRFHIPLIEPLTEHGLSRVEPDVRISRIWLSFKDSYGRPRDEASLLLKPDKTKHFVKILGGKA